MRSTSGNTKSTDFSQVFYSIFLTALIMSIFETIFAYIIVFPNIESQLNKLFSSQNQSETEQSFAKKLAKQEVDALLLSAKTRENNLKTVINKHAKAFALLLSFSLCVITIFLGYKIIKNKASDIVAPTVHAVLTVIILISFQMFFYQFGQKYRYMKPDEVQPELMQAICANVKLDTKDVEDNLKADVTAAMTELTFDVVNSYIDEAPPEIKNNIKPVMNPLREFMGNTETSFDGLSSSEQ